MSNRLIKIQSPMVYKLKKEIDAIQKEANPILKKMEKMSKTLDPFFTKLRELETEKQKIQAEMKPTKELYDIELKKVEVKEQKAQLIKNKLQPIVDDEIKGQLGEFEAPLHLTEKDGALFVEVIDKVEEFKKAYLARKK